MTVCYVTFEKYELIKANILKLTLNSLTEIGNVAE